jgi:hypothetical protein
MTGRELLREVLRDTWDVPLDHLASDSYADDIAATPSGAELIRRADAEPVLRAALEAIQSELGRYWEHGDDCPAWEDGGDDCDCGIERLLRDIEAALTTPDAPG